MNKALFFALISFLFLSSCSKKQDKSGNNSSGKINSISVMIEEQLWNSEIGDSIRNKFASPVIGLPQEEPLFNINQYPSKFLEGYMADSRNIIIIKRGQENSIRIEEKKGLKPQNIFHISGKNANIIIDLIEKNSPLIIEKMRLTEINENQRIIDTALIDTKKIEEKFKIGIHIPKGYKYVLEKKKFLWLKKEIPSGNTSLLIYQVPYTCLKKPPTVIHNIIQIRDSIGELYIKGTLPKSNMITEDSYAPYLFNTIIDGTQTFETKGTWQLLNDYMNGPFINYCILDKNNNRILVLEGFCYAPSKEKRDLMFELEAIIKSTKLINTKKNKQ